MSHDIANWNKTWYSTASESDRKLFREWMIGLLKSERVNICFTKVDGTERWLHCTLHPELLPEAEVTEGKSVRQTSTEAQSVWDIDKQAWRSFRWDSIQQFSFNLGDLHV